MKPFLDAQTEIWLTALEQAFSCRGIITCEVNCEVVYIQGCLHPYRKIVCYFIHCYKEECAAKDATLWNSLLLAVGVREAVANFDVEGSLI